MYVGFLFLDVDKFQSYLWVKRLSPSKSETNLTSSLSANTKKWLNNSEAKKLKGIQHNMTMD